MAANDKQAKTSGVNQKLRLQEELIKLIKEIDEEGLLFLIQQTNVLRYNMQIDKINNEQEKIVKGNAKKVSTNVPKNHVEIFPGDQNKNFIIQLNTARKFMSRQDFRGIVRIAQSPDSITEITKRLFRWLSKERSDILHDCKIGSSTDPLLKEFVKVVKSKYKIKE